MKRAANEEKKEKNKKNKSGSQFPTQKINVAGKSNAPKAVLLLAGSFSPITYMHLRLLGSANTLFFLETHHDIFL